MTAWAHLPNAKHIDHVLEALKVTPKVAALGAAWNAARGADRDAALGAAWGAARGAAWDAARGAALGAISGAAWDAAWVAARGAARDAILALIAYDEAGDLMNHSPEQLNGLYQLTEHPMFLLLQPFLTIYPGEKQ